MSLIGAILGWAIALCCGVRGEFRLLLFMAVGGTVALCLQWLKMEFFE